MKNVIFNSIIEGQGVLVYHDNENARVEVYFRNLKTLKDNLLQTIVELCLNTEKIESHFVHAPELDPGSVRELMLAIQPLQKKAVIIASTFHQTSTPLLRFIKPSNLVTDYQRALEFLSPDWYEVELNKKLGDSLNIQDALSKSIDEIFPELRDEEVSIEEAVSFNEELYQRKQSKAFNGYDLDI